ncbi:hypothetical protein IAU60_000367 [Kwoniella sp. DSM 27419]
MSRPNISYPTPVSGPSSYNSTSPRPSLGLDPSPIGRESGTTPAPPPAVIPPRRQASITKSGGQYNSALDSSITRLLVTTKQLLQGLDQWSQAIISETDVSDIYVRLGNGFEVCIQAFQKAGLGTAELDSIPNELRACLEQCLSYEQSHETLQVYLPQIRQIIFKLLSGLKEKQASYKRILQERQQPDAHPFSSSYSSVNLSQSSITPSTHSTHSQQSGQYGMDPGSYAHAPTPAQQPRRPSRGESIPSDGENRLSARSGNSTASASPASVNAQLPRDRVPSSSRLAERGQRSNLPTRPPPPDAFRPPRVRPSDASLASTASTQAAAQAPTRRSLSPSLPHAPEPVRHQLVDKPVPLPSGPPSITIQGLPPSQAKVPPRPERFSRDSYGSHRPVSRFSADSDITNGSPIRSPPSRRRNDSIGSLPEADSEDEQEAETSNTSLLPSLPVLNLPAALELPDEPSALAMTGPVPSQSLPDVPPETRATLAALQRSDALERRASKRFSSYTFNKMLPGSPGKKSGTGSPQRPTRRVERPPPMPALPESLANASRSVVGQPEPVRSPLSDARADYISANGNSPMVEAAPSSPLINVTSDDSSDRSVRIVKTPESSEDIAAHATPRPRTSLPASPTSLSLFLQIGRQVKRATVDLPISLSNLRLLFMERFEYDPGMEDFPDVYLRDPKTGVQFEVEDMDDLKEGCVLSLNIEPLDQVKQHFDTTFASLMMELKEMKKAMETSRRVSMTPSPSLLTVSLSAQMSRPNTIRRPSTDTAAASPNSTGSAVPLPCAESPSPRPVAVASLRPDKAKELQVQYDELQSLRRDLAIMRQLHVDFLSDTKESFGQLRAQNSAMREVVKTKMGGSRALLDNSKAKLEARCQDTIQAVEEISDTVDAAREDAYKRFVTPSKNQMATIRSNLDKAKALVDQFASDVQLADPTWRATWQTELHRVMEEQKLLSYQLKLCSDLKNDIRDASEMFNNVQTFVDQRAANPRLGSKTFRPPPGEDDDPTSPSSGGGINHLLMEIRTKEADPTSRLRAIEAQQRAREKEKASQVDEFEQELKIGGRKLKKTGGTEEAERMRLRRQEVTLRKMMSGGAPGEQGVLSPQSTGNTTTRVMSPQATGGAPSGPTAAVGERLIPQMTGGSGVSIAAALDPGSPGVNTTAAPQVKSEQESADPGAGFEGDAGQRADAEPEREEAIEELEGDLAGAAKEEPRD